MLITGCGSAIPSPTLSGSWRLAYVGLAPLPVERPALSADRGALRLVWPGEVGLPNLRLVIARTPARTGSQHAQPILLPLGIRPRHIQLYSLSGDRWQVLWLDQALSGVHRLVGGTLDAGGEVLRGPTAITPRPALQFSAAPTPEGDLVVLWNEAQGDQTPLFAARIDSRGRPFPPLLIAATGRYPALAVDRMGNLHMAWLQASSGQLWTLLYTTLSAEALRAGRQPQAAQQVGVLRLKSAHVLEGVVLGLDADNLYLVWNVVRLGEVAQGALDGITFPMGDPQAVRSLPLDTAGLSARWLTLANPSIGGAARVGGRTALGFSAGSRPAVIYLNAEGPNKAQPITEGAGPAIGPTSLVYDERGTLYVAWTVFRPDGQTAIFVANDTEATPMTTPLSMRAP